MPYVQWQIVHAYSGQQKKTIQQIKEAMHSWSAWFVKLDDETFEPPVRRLLHCRLKKNKKRGTLLQHA